jgi:hypothetical protein
VCIGGRVRTLLRTFWLHECKTYLGQQNTCHYLCQDTALWTILGCSYSMLPTYSLWQKLPCRTDGLRPIPAEWGFTIAIFLKWLIMLYIWCDIHCLECCPFCHVNTLRCLYNWDNDLEPCRLSHSQHSNPRNSRDPPMARGVAALEAKRRFLRAVRC